MKSPRLLDDLVPVQDLRSQLAHYIERVEETGRPVVITQRGRAAAALVSPAMLDELEADRELVRRTLRGLRDLKAGRIDDAESVLRPKRWRGARGKAEPDGGAPIGDEPASPKASGGDGDPRE